MTSGPGPNLGDRVVVVRHASLGEPRDWLAVADVAGLTASVEPPKALMLDLRGSGFALASRDADVMASGLAAYRMVAVVADPGVSYGCARMACTLVDLRGSPAAAFTDEGEAWRWLSAQLGVPLRGGLPPPELRSTL